MNFCETEGPFTWVRILIHIEYSYLDTPPFSEKALSIKQSQGTEYKLGIFHARSSGIAF
jgi:hypothetical protein